MKKKTAILKNDKGSVIIAALLILVLLTIMGISSISTSNIELGITNNSQLHKMAFYTAESGWRVMANWLDDRYPLPTVSLGSDDSGNTAGIDDDGDGQVDELDEYIDFTQSQADQASDGLDNDGDLETDEEDEGSVLLPLSLKNPNYQYRVTSEFEGAQIAPGWDPTLFVRYTYKITSTAEIPAREGNARSQITVTGGKIDAR